jgi:hypothetical protein
MDEAIGTSLSSGSHVQRNIVIAAIDAPCIRDLTTAKIVGRPCGLRVGHEFNQVSFHCGKATGRNTTVTGSFTERARGHLSVSMTRGSVGPFLGSGIQERTGFAVLVVEFWVCTGRAGE